jgi:hypothetical protein
VKDLTVTALSPKRTVQIGTFSMIKELEAAIEAKGYKILAGHLLKKVGLASEPATVEVFEVTIRDLGFTHWVPRDELYEKVTKLGFVPVSPEVGPQILLQFGNELEPNVLYIVGSEPIDYLGWLYLFTIDKNEKGVWLHDVLADPEVAGWWWYERFLFSRK